MHIPEDGKSLAMLCDFYELTMGNGYYINDIIEKEVAFDLFFRSIPDDGGFAICAGLSQVIEYLRELKFSPEDIGYLRSTGVFDEGYLNYLANFRFCCDVWAIPEGTPIFPQEPIMIVKGPAIQAQLIETMLLLTVNHQSLIATKSNRIVRAAKGRPIMEFGARRAHGAGSSLYGARAAYIGGCTATSCTLASKQFGIPFSGTMAHSWVQVFDSEYEAFKRYAEVFPDSTVLLVDTYNVLTSGIPNAIRVFDEVLKPLGKRPSGIRIDSGDVTYLSRKARNMLDDAGYPDCKVVISNSMDEYIIRDTLLQGAQIDSFGVGERLITSQSDPVFGGVYKLSAVFNEDGSVTPKIKISANVSKITLPHFKNVFRLYAKSNGQAIADVISLHDEKIDESRPFELFHPEFTWKRKTVVDFEARELLLPIFKRGEYVYNEPSLDEIRRYCESEVGRLWDEVKRFENPHVYYVDLTRPLWEVRTDMLNRRNK